MHKLIQDSKLTNEADILERIASVRRQRNILCDKETRSHHISAFKAKQAKIAKLTEREGLLLSKLKTIRKGAL